MKTTHMTRLQKTAREHGCRQFDKVATRAGEVWLGWGSRIDDEKQFVGVGYLCIDLGQHAIGRSMEFEPFTSDKEKRRLLILHAEDLYKDFADVRDDSFWTSDRHGRQHS